MLSKVVSAANDQQEREKRKEEPDGRQRSQTTNTLGEWEGKRSLALRGGHLKGMLKRLEFLEREISLRPTGNTNVRGTKRTTRFWARNKHLGTNRGEKVLEGWRLVEGGQPPLKKFLLLACGRGVIREPEEPIPNAGV